MSLAAVPRLLILFRFFAGPLVVALVWRFGEEVRFYCAGLLALGVLSDIFDGVIARRIGVATPQLRKLDSKADIAFWLSVLVAVLILRPEARASMLAMSGMLALEFVAPIVSLIRFRQEASTHHVLSKVFGLGLWVLMTVLFIHGQAPRLQIAVFVLGVVSQAEAIAIMLVVPLWRASRRSA